METARRKGAKFSLPAAIFADLSKNKKAKFDPRWPLVTWPLTSSKKWRSSVVMAFFVCCHGFWRYFECHLPRDATWPRSRGWRGCSNIPLSPASCVRSRSSARCGLSELGTNLLHATHLGDRFCTVLTEIMGCSAQGLEVHAAGNPILGFLPDWLDPIRDLKIAILCM